MHPGLGSTTYHVAVLFCTMLPVVLLAKSMAKMIQYGIVRTRAPQELGGFLVAILVRPQFHTQAGHTGRQEGHRGGGRGRVAGRAQEGR